MRRLTVWRVARKCEETHHRAMMMMIMVWMRCSSAQRTRSTRCVRRWVGVGKEGGLTRGYASAGAGAGGVTEIYKHCALRARWPPPPPLQYKLDPQAKARKVPVRVDNLPNGIELSFRAAARGDDAFYHEPLDLVDISCPPSCGKGCIWLLPGSRQLTKLEYKLSSAEHPESRWAPPTALQATLRCMDLAVLHLARRGPVAIASLLKPRRSPPHPMQRLHGPHIAGLPCHSQQDV